MISQNEISLSDAIGRSGRVESFAEKIAKGENLVVRIDDVSENSIFGSPGFVSYGSELKNTATEALNAIYKTTGIGFEVELASETDISETRSDFSIAPVSMQDAKRQLTELCLAAHVGRHQRPCSA